VVPFVDKLAAPGTTPERWLVGLSKSGFGALSLIFRNPTVFSAAACWDAPAQVSSITTYSGMQENFGTEENFDNYEIPRLVAQKNGPFHARNRIWISGDNAIFTSEMQQLDQQMTAPVLVHTFVGGATRVHNWGSGWLDGAIQGLANTSN